jgi:dihydrofolate reductase
MARQLVYQVAASLDGYIADRDGAYDWIVADPDIDFAALYARFDTVVLGRHSFELVLRQHANGRMPGLDVVVFSRTLRAADYPAVTMTADDPADVVAALKTRAGKDIWLWGGGVLFRSLLAAGQVDVVEIAVIPVLLGGGLPLLAPGDPLRASLRLTGTKTYATSGIVLLSYAVPPTTG